MTRTTNSLKPDGTHHWQRGDYQVSTDRCRLDRQVIHHYLSHDAYWSRGIPLDTVNTAIDHSLCTGLYHDQQQIGFARLVTDYATFGYLADVFILPAHRGHGLSRWMLGCLFQLPEVQGLRRIMLATADAHELYRPLGFGPSAHPQRLMEIHRPNLYRSLVKTPKSSV